MSRRNLVSFLFGLLIVGSAIGIVVGGYWQGWKWTGFVVESAGTTGPTLRTLRDWLELLLIPLTIVVAGYFLNQAQWRREDAVEQRRIDTERANAADERREQQLQLYFDRISDLLLGGGLRESSFGDGKRAVAQIWTLAILRSLDPKRKAILLKFIYEAGLIWATDSIIKLDNADLSGLDLYKANLNQTDLRGTNLSKSTMRKADLFGANLSLADLSGVDLSGASCFRGQMVAANFRDALLTECDFEQADISGSDFSNAKMSGSSLRGAIVRGANFDRADLSHVNFGVVSDNGQSRVSDLSGASFVGSDLSFVDLSDAYLFGADFSDAILVETKFDPDSIWQATGIVQEPIG